MKPRKIARRITPEYLHNAALYYLQRYAASTGRVRRILTQKIERSCRDHPDQNLQLLLPLVDKEIETLTRVELLQDNRLANQLIEGYRARGLPGRRIEQKLNLKGFDPDLIKHLNAQHAGLSADETEQLAARRYLERRKLWPFLKDTPGDPGAMAKAKQKSWAALARQGYDPDIIREAMLPASAMPE